MKKILDVIINDIRNVEKVVSEIRDNENINPLELELAALKAESLHQELLLLSRSLKKHLNEDSPEIDSDMEPIAVSEALNEVSEDESEPEIEATKAKYDSSFIESINNELTDETTPEESILPEEQDAMQLEDEVSMDPEIPDNCSNKTDIDRIEEQDATENEPAAKEESFNTNELAHITMDNNDPEIPTLDDISAIEAAVKSLKREVMESEADSNEVEQAIQNEKILPDEAAEADSTEIQEPLKQLNEEEPRTLIDDLFPEETASSIESNEPSSDSEEDSPKNNSNPVMEQEPLRVEVEAAVLNDDIPEGTTEEPVISDSDSDSGNNIAIQENNHELPVEEISLQKESSKKEESGVTVLGEKFVSRVKSINDIFSSKVKVEKNPFENVLSMSLKSSISINDRFLFIKDLFEGNQVQYTEAIEKLDSCDNIREAVGYLKSNYRWHHSVASQKFLELVKQRFSN